MADRYWVGGGASTSWGATGNTNWSDISGGAGNKSVPTSADNAIFDVNSGALACAISATANCLSLTIDANYTGTLSGSNSLNIYGGLTLGANMGLTLSGAFVFRAPSGSFNITTNGKAMTADLTFSGAGTLVLQDPIVYNAGCSITINAGTFDLNDQNTEFLTFSGAAGTFILGNGTMTLHGSWANTGSAITCEGSTINILVGSTTFTGNGQTYNIVNMTGGGGMSIVGANTFSTLNVTGTNVKTDSLRLFADQTIANAGTLTLAGQSTVYLLLVKSDTLGTARTFTFAGTVTITGIDYVDFRDITFSSSKDLSALSIGDAGGNTNITFPAPANMFWYTSSGGAKAWDAPGNWFIGSGGTGGAGRVPRLQDTAVFDSASIGAAGTTITITSMPRVCKITVNSDVANTPTFSLSQDAEYYGSIAFVAGMIFTPSSYTLNFYNRTAATLNSGGKTFYSINVYSFGSSLSLAADLVMSNAFWLTNGTFDAANYNISATRYAIYGSLTRILTMGSGTWTILNSGASAWDASSVTNLTVNANTSTIKLTANSAADSTFNGGGKTYYNLWQATLGAGILKIVGSNTFNDIKVDAGRTIKFTAGTTTTVTTFTAIGTSTSGITIGSITAATHTLTKAGGGTISVEYCTVSYSIANPDTTWYGLNSIDGGNNTRWYITAPVSLLLQGSMVII